MIAADWRENSGPIGMDGNGHKSTSREFDLAVSRSTFRSPFACPVKMSSTKTPTTTVFNPQTLEKIGDYNNTDLASFPEIFKNARRAQKVWAEMSFSQPKPCIMKLKNNITKNAD